MFQYKVLGSGIQSGAPAGDNSVHVMNDDDVVIGEPIEVPFNKMDPDSREVQITTNSVPGNPQASNKTGKLRQD